MSSWSDPRVNHWFNRTADASPAPSEWAKRVEREAQARLAARADAGRREDAADLKKRLRALALVLDCAYDDAKSIAADLGIDGHKRAAGKVGQALLRLKQAETELEEARGLVMAEQQMPPVDRRPW